MAQVFHMNRNASAYVDLGLRIETPENVELTFQLAGPANRTAAYLVDLAIRGMIVALVFIVLVFSSLIVPGTSAGSFLLVLFFLQWAYYVICESLFRGKTVGKHVFGLRVIHIEGHPITFWSALLRNLLRAVDALPLYGIGFVSMLFSKRLQRLGDLAARTVVVQEHRVKLPRLPFILEKIAPLSRDEIGQFKPAQQTLALIDHFLGRRYAINVAQGHAMTSGLASVLAERLNYQGDPALVDEYPMAFLARVYVTFVERSEDASGMVESSESRPHVWREPSDLTGRATVRILRKFPVR